MRIWISLSNISKAMAETLNARDVLDMQLMQQAARRKRDLVYTTSPESALEIFAYDLVEAADLEDQNEVLSSLLERMTFAQSKETNEQVVCYLANLLNADLSKLRQFAKQAGVRLKRG